MNSATLYTAIGGVLITGIILICFFQWRQRSTEARQAQIRELKIRARRLQNMADGLHGGYVSADIRLLLSKSGLETVRSLRALGGITGDDSEVEWIAYAARAQTAAAEPVPQLSAAGEDAVVRKLLKSLQSFIEEQVRIKRLSKDVALERIEHTRFLVAKSAADSHHRKAIAAVKAGRLRVAIHHYHDAVAGFGRLHENGNAVRYINAFRAKIRDLEVRATDEQRALLGNAAPADSSNDRVGKEWDKLAEEADSWKKKTAYD